MSKGRHSKFNADVLKETDANSDPISLWCIPGNSPGEAICTMCNIVISCKHHGSAAVKRHATSAKHIAVCLKSRDSNGKLKTPSQRRLTFAAPETSSTIRSHADLVTTSETLFAITVARFSVPFSFADKMGTIFPLMFPDSQIAKDLACNRNKLSYLISDGIGPYLKDKLISEITSSGTFYTLQIDETPVAEKRVQQFDVLVRFYSDTAKEIVVHHLESFHIGKGDADVLFGYLEQAMAPLPKEKLICLCTDGPPVMKRLKKIVKENYSQILDISTCTLHVVHNAFGKALIEFGGDLETLLIDIYYYFKHSAVSSELFSSLQSNLGVPNHFFVRHVSNRWLTLQKSLERFLEQFDCLKKFFEQDVNSRSEGARVRRIKEAFNDKFLLAKALFLQNACTLLMPYLTLFQCDKPLIHIIYDEFSSLVKRVMGRFLKISCFKSKLGMKLKSLDIQSGENWLKEPEIGSDSLKEISKFTATDKKNIFLGARAFYLKCTEYLLNNLPFKNKILRDMQCLHPLMKNEQKSVSAIKSLAVSIPSLIKPSDISTLSDEWIRYQCLDIPGSSETQRQRIDHYWRSVFESKDSSGKYVFELLPKLVKCLLSLAHGNADIERGFSINKHMMDNRSSLSINSINGIRQIKSYFKDEESIKNFVITPSLLKEVRNARQKYHTRLELAAQNKKRSIEEIEGSEQKLRAEEIELRKKLKNAQEMLQHAETKISEGIARKDMSSIESGQVLLAEGKTRMNVILKELEENRNAQNKENKKKC